MILLDGRKVGKHVQEMISSELKKARMLRPPGIAFILVGDNPASHSYVQAKKKRCSEIGFLSFDQELPATIDQAELLRIIRHLNAEPRVDGILVQLPLPPHLNPEMVLQEIDPSKDVDGFHPLNMGKLLLGQEGGFCPCTPYGIIELLSHYKISLENKHAVIVGRSNIVGKPLAALCIQKKNGLNATVTIAHSQTPDLSSLCRTADLLVAAVGHPRLIGPHMVKKGAVVVDVGITRASNGKLVGDVDFEAVAPLSSAITPVPGGVGPMTIAMLLKNTWSSRKKRSE